MDNTNVGGNRGSYAGEPVDFDELFSAGGQELNNSSNSSGTMPEGTTMTSKEMGEAAVFSGMGFGPEAASKDVHQEMIPVRNNGESLEDGNWTPKTEQIIEPLSKDGSTEGRIGRLAVSLSGDVMDEASTKEVQKKITEFKNDPFELQNYRDRAMVESLRDNYGRIFADDGNEAIGVAEMTGADKTGANEAMADAGAIGDAMDGIDAGGVMGGSMSA